MRQVLVDTSVWIDFFRWGKSTESQQLEDLLKEDRACVTALIRAELLSGARHEKEYQRLKDYFSAIPVLNEPEDLWDRVALRRFQLARRGIQASLTDLSIAVLADFHHYSLFSLDNAFSLIAQVIPLRFYSAKKF